MTARSHQNSFLTLLNYSGQPVTNCLFSKTICERGLKFINCVICECAGGGENINFRCSAEGVEKEIFTVTLIKRHELINKIKCEINGTSWHRDKSLQCVKRNGHTIMSHDSSLGGHKKSCVCEGSNKTTAHSSQRAKVTLLPKQTELSLPALSINKRQKHIRADKYLLSYSFI